MYFVDHNFFVVPPKTICNTCGEMPEFYCSDCGMKDMQPGDRLFLCAQCTSTVHRHPDRQKHKPQRFNLKTASTRKVKLDLLSVVCMEKNRYVCFCRHGNRWFFFDSMADRTGLYVQNTVVSTLWHCAYYVCMI